MANTSSILGVPTWHYYATGVISIHLPSEGQRPQNCIYCLSWATPHEQHRIAPVPVSRFSSLDHQPATLTWSGGGVPLFGTTAFSFAIDVPDGVGGLNLNGFNRFTLRQFPIAPTPVPEPRILVLLGAGLAGIGLKLRRRLS
ncbi:MAG: PEP-CTERM sorting domain-containing protein [Bryobacterales bacterium]|nr:PEP-CTERM sorting domain-containing protein [Bryobacterales bacterium]